MRHNEDFRMSSEPSSSPSSPPSTPLMRQYHGLKQQVPNTLLMFRLGDFYELFYEDAVTAARELEITLTARNKEKGQPIPMCGVPYHSAESYIARLTQKGYRVAICEQMEAPSAATKLVRREVTRIITPGTTMNASLLRSHENNFLGAVMPEGARAGFAFVDVTTGEFRATEMELADAAAALETLNVREVLAPAGSPQKFTCLKTDVEIVGLRSGLRGAQFVRSFPAALARRLRSGGEAAGYRCGGGAAALSARDAAQRTRSSVAAVVLQPRRCAGAGCDYRSQSGIGRASVRGRVIGFDAAFGAGSDAHRHGRTSAAAPLARAIARAGRDRSAPGRGGGTVHAVRFCAANWPRISDRFWIWSGCCRRSAWRAQVRGTSERWRGRWRWCPR